MSRRKTKSKRRENEVVVLPSQRRAFASISILEWITFTAACVTRNSSIPLFKVEDVGALACSFLTLADFRTATQTSRQLLAYRDPKKYSDEDRVRLENPTLYRQRVEDKAPFPGFATRRVTYDLAMHAHKRWKIGDLPEKSDVLHQQFVDLCEKAGNTLTSKSIMRRGNLFSVLSEDASMQSYAVTGPISEMDTVDAKRDSSAVEVEPAPAQINHAISKKMNTL